MASEIELKPEIEQAHQAYWDVPGTFGSDFELSLMAFKAGWEAAPTTVVAPKGDGVREAVEAARFDTMCPRCDGDGLYQPGASDAPCPVCDGEKFVSVVPIFALPSPTVGVREQGGPDLKKARGEFEWIQQISRRGVEKVDEVLGGLLKSQRSTKITSGLNDLRDKFETLTKCGNDGLSAFSTPAEEGR